MSSINWSDRLTFLSYATLNYSYSRSLMKTASVKTDRDNGIFSIISLTEFQEALSEGKCVKRVTLTLSGADVRARRVGINSYTYWGLYRFFQEHFLRQWNLTTVSSAQMEGVYGDVYVRWCNTWKASLALILWQAVLTFKTFWLSMNISSSYSK